MNYFYFADVMHKDLGGKDKTENRVLFFHMERGTVTNGVAAEVWDDRANDLHKKSYTAEWSDFCEDKESEAVKEAKKARTDILHNERPTDEEAGRAPKALTELEMNQGKTVEGLKGDKAPAELKGDEDKKTDASKAKGKKFF